MSSVVKVNRESCNHAIEQTACEPHLKTNNGELTNEIAQELMFNEYVERNYIFNDNVEQWSNHDNHYFANNERNNYFNESSENSSSKINSENLINCLQVWASNFQISLSAINALLSILRENNHSDLPKDGRTLKKTPKTTCKQIQFGNDGACMHFGLENGLKHSIIKYFKIYSDVIFLQLNCDGASISTSSTSQFWPLLVAIQADFYSEPFLVGIFHGYSKPKDVNVFLLPFVNDMENIAKNGINVNGKVITVILNTIICDAPAKAYITCTKYHTGYFGCGKCTQEGEWNGTVIFPEIDSPLRTDESFITMKQEEHHNGESILTQLKIGMVSNVTIDYMHLVCLGVMKRLLQLWTKGSKDHKLPKNSLDVLNTNLLAIKKLVPSEFARQPRAVDIVDKWKATECRQFLLYSGPIVLKSILSEAKYNHFLALSVAIRILCDSKFCFILNDYANSLLRWFVLEYKKLYGYHYITYNVHHLIHLSNKVKKFGCLDKFSSFKFESFIKKIKNRVKHSPLEQVINRTLEINSLPISKDYERKYPIIHQSKKTLDISKVEYNGFIISRKTNDNCCLLSNSTVLIVKKFFIKNNVLYIRGNKY